MGNSKLNWKLWIVNGDKYLKSATPKSKTSRFNNEIRYNLLSMSFESYVKAICNYHNKLPENHTYTDLINCLESVISIDPKLKNRILQYENIQSICSIAKYHRTSPEEKELIDLGGAIVEISQLAHKTCLEN